MREDILRELRNEYAEMRANSEATLLRRTEIIRKEHPNIFALTEERKNLIFSGLRGILRSEKQIDFSETMSRLNNQIEDSLEQIGYDRNWLEPEYRCALCRDSGYTGETIREMCTCMKRRYQEKLNQLDSLTAGSDECFESFDLSLFSEEKIPGHSYSQRELMARCRETCEDWANAWPNSNIRHILLMGQTGLGKTFLLNAIARRLHQRGVSAITVSAYHFQDLARKAWLGDDNNEALESLLNSDVLLMDDVGTEPMMRSITVEQFFNLINERDLHKHATVISTNLSRTEFQEKYTERIASRLMDQHCSTVMILQGNDLRMGK